jgi:hypothetical protein
MNRPAILDAAFRASGKTHDWWRNFGGVDVREVFEKIEQMLTYGVRRGPGADVCAEELDEYERMVRMREEAERTLSAFELAEYRRHVEAQRAKIIEMMKGDE